MATIVNHNTFLFLVTIVDSFLRVALPNLTYKKNSFKLRVNKRLVKKSLLHSIFFGLFFSFLQLTFNCIFERIEKQHNVTCPSSVRNEAKAMYAVDVYKGLPLKFQPDSCTLFD